MRRIIDRHPVYVPQKPLVALIVVRKEPEAVVRHKLAERFGQRPAQLFDLQRTPKQSPDVREESALMGLDFCLSK